MKKNEVHDSSLDSSILYRWIIIWALLLILCAVIFFFIIRPIITGNVVSPENVSYNLNVSEIPVSSCQVLTHSGVYVLSNSLNWDYGSTCLKLVQPGIVLDCRGNAIVRNSSGYSGDSSMYGIYSDQPDTTIRNCVINVGKERGYGIYLGSEAHRAHILTATVFNASIGVYVNGATGVRIENSSIRTSDLGIDSLFSRDFSLLSTTLKSNGDGLHLLGSNRWNAHLDSFLNNTRGVYLINSSSSEQGFGMVNSTFSGNVEVALLVRDVVGTPFINNLFSDNGQGLVLSHSSNNFVYYNYFARNHHNDTVFIDESRQNKVVHASLVNGSVSTAVVDSTSMDNSLYQQGDPTIPSLATNVVVSSSNVSALPSLLNEEPLITPSFVVSLTKWIVLGALVLVVVAIVLVIFGVPRRFSFRSSSESSGGSAISAMPPSPPSSRHPIPV